MGDATGGYLATVFTVPSAAEAFKYVWSLERAGCYYDSSPGADEFGMISLITAEKYTDGGGTNNYIILKEDLRMFFSALVDTAIVDGQRGRVSLMNFPFRPDKGLTWSCSMNVVNVSGIPVIFVVRGFVWHPQVYTNAGGWLKP